ncbi:MAG: GNAT family N-acetyltransferase [Actinomycetota bacterium]
MTHGRAEILTCADGLRAVAEEWNPLALAAGTPFLTVEWLASWWESFGGDRSSCLLLRDAQGSLRGGVCYATDGRRRLTSATNAYSEDWDVVAADDEARRAMWFELCSLRPGQVDLRAMRNQASLQCARQVFQEAGYSFLEFTTRGSPYLTLPDTWDELLATVGRKLRKALGNRRRALEREGSVSFRTISRGPGLTKDLDAFIAVEGSGWRAAAQTAIQSNVRTELLYRGFAYGAAQAGWLRLHLLELDGVAIAGDLSCRFAGGSFLIKTGYDERFSSLSPGLLLRGEALHAAIDEGSRFYDFLGGPDHYKMRWASELRPRTSVKAYRGPHRALALYWTRLRPAAKACLRRSARVIERGQG